MGHGLDVINDYCRVGESGAWLICYLKDYCLVGESGAWLSRYEGLLPGR